MSLSAQCYSIINLFSRRIQDKINPSPLKKYFPHLFILFVFSSLLIFSKAGADIDRYEEWAVAFKHGDIFALSGEIFSPMKIPLSHWSFGPGLLFSIGYFLTPVKDPTFGSYFMGWIYIIIFWWAFIGILHYSAKGDLTLTFFGVCIAFLGTPLGYYSSAFSSESLSFTFLAVMLYWVLTQKEWNTIDFLFMGILSALLIIVRPQLVVYCIPVYSVIFYRFIEMLKKKAFINACITLFLAILPVVLGIIPILFQNRWMTGSLFSNPYIHNSNTFKSINWGNPEILASLFHPWHGLLSYHPLYGFSFISLILLIYYKRSIFEKLFLLGLTIAVIFIFYLNASFYSWWEGSGSFGSRASSIGAIVFIPALIHFLSIKDRKYFSNILWCAFIFLACVWSFLLLMQNKFGSLNNLNTNFFTFKQLLNAQYIELYSLFSFRTISSLILLLIFGIVTWLNIKRIRLYQYLIILMLFYMVMEYLLFKFDFPRLMESLNYNYHYRIWYPFWKIVIPAKMVDAQYNKEIFSIMDTIITIIGTLVIPFFVKNILLSQNLYQSINKRLLFYLPYTFIALFCILTILFTRLALNTERYIASGEIPQNRCIKYITSVHIPNLEGDYREYLKVPGFEKQKIALYNELTFQKEKARITLEKEKARISQSICN